MELNITKSDLKNYAIIALLCVVIVILLSTTCSLKNKLNVANNNIEVMHDSVETVELKNGELLQYKQAYILKSKDYADYMNITDKKIKELEKKLDSKITEIAVLESFVSQNDIQMTDTVIVRNDTTDILFYYRDEWNEIGGQTSISGEAAYTTIDSLKTRVPLVVGITEDNKIFATSENPYVSFPSIDGALNTSNKKTHKSFGFKVVVGPSLIYDPIRNQAAIGIGVTAGFGWGYGINY